MVYISILEDGEYNVKNVETLKIGDTTILEDGEEYKVRKLEEINNSLNIEFISVKCIQPKLLDAIKIYNTAELILARPKKIENFQKDVKKNKNIDYEKSFL